CIQRKRFPLSLRHILVWSDLVNGSASPSQPHVCVCEWCGCVCASCGKVILSLIVSGVYFGVETPSQLGAQSKAYLIAEYVGIYTFQSRSEERRVGEECRSRWSPYH